MWRVFGIYIIFNFFLANNIFAEKFEILYPKPTDSLECGSEIQIKWNNPDKKAINLYYSYNNSDWALIAEKIDSDSFNWQIPFSINNHIFFKAEIEDKSSGYIIWDNKNAHNGEVRVAKFTNNNRIISCGADGYIKYWDISKRSIIRQLRTDIGQSLYFVLEYEPEKFLLFFNTSIYKWESDISNFELIYSNDILEHIRSADYDPNYQEVAIASNDGIIRVINLFGKVMASFLTDEANKIYTIDYSNDGRYIAAAGENGYIYLIDTETEIVRKSVEHHGVTDRFVVWSLSISPNNIFIISGGVDNKVYLWDFNSLDIVYDYQHDFHVRAAKFNSSGTMYLSGSLDSTLRQYNITDKIEKKGFRLNHNAQILWAEYLNKGDTLITAGRDNGFKVWRNSQTDYTAAYSSANLYQNLEIYFTNLKIALNQNGIIPVNIKGNTDFIDSIEIEFFMPVDILDIEGFKTVKKVNKDELFEFVKNNEIKGTLKEYPVTALLGTRKKANIKLFDYTIYPLGNYKVMADTGSVEIIDYCGSDSTRFVSIDEHNPQIVVYPNPVEKNLNIDVYAVVDDYVEIIINDNDGKKIKAVYNGYINHGYNKMNIDISNLINGTYFITAKWNDRIISKKIMKQN